MITAPETSRRPAQMVWASVWLDERGRPRRSPLIIIDIVLGRFACVWPPWKIDHGPLPHSLCGAGQGRLGPSSSFGWVS
jgi:hypothetical protein